MKKTTVKNGWHVLSKEGKEIHLVEVKHDTIVSYVSGWGHSHESYEYLWQEARTNPEEYFEDFLALAVDNEEIDPDNEDDVAEFYEGLIDHRRGMGELPHGAACEMDNLDDDAIKLIETTLGFELYFFEQESYSLNRLPAIAFEIAKGVTVIKNKALSNLVLKHAVLAGKQEISDLNRQLTDFYKKDHGINDDTDTPTPQQKHNQTTINRLGLAKKANVTSKPRPNHLKLVD